MSEKRMESSMEQLADMKNGANTQPEHCEISRRDFLKLTATTGGVALLGSIPFVRRVMAQGGEEYSYLLSKPENQIYTACLQCNTGCPIKVKLVDGVAAKIDGNPYSPWTMMPHIDYSTPIADAAIVEGAICPKGQSGLQTVYDPYRIVSVMKRKPGTARGAGQWITAPFGQAIDEIVNGGDLFGEGSVPGLKESYVLSDPDLAKEMAAAVKKIQDESDADKKRNLVAEFKRTFAAHLDMLIDPDHPDLGPKNNQVAFVWGRLKDGRSHLIKRWINSGFGSTNAHGHTTVCQGSLYFTGKAMSEKFIDGKWSGGDKFYWQGDVQNSEFVIFVGASPFEGNYGPPYRGRSLTNNIIDNGMKMVVVDPRFSKTAAKAWKWLPIKPGTEAALALGLMRWIFDNERYDAKYLSSANKAAAVANGEPTWTEATWLVKLDDHGNPGKFLRASEIGLHEKETRPLSTDPEKTYEFDYFVTLVDGQPVPVDPYAEDSTVAVNGDLFVDRVRLGDFVVKSGLQIIAESAREHSLEEWAEICGLAPHDLEEVALEFTSHGKKAVADIHRGVSQHTNGFYNVLAWYTLNALIGNHDWKGGLSKLAAYKIDGSKKGQPFNINKADGAQAPFGISMIRHDQKYDKSTLFLRDGYPAKRNWYPLSSDIYQEIVPSIGDAYPYPIKAMFLYMGSPVYSLPAGNTNIPILSDTQKLPLLVAIDAFIGETSMYADYIFPDTMFLERWEFGGSHPSIPFKVQPVRNPAIAPLVPEVNVYRQTTPMSLEAVLLALAEALGLKGFGPGGFGEYGDLTHPDDLYIKMAADLAFGEKEDGSDAVPDADEEEIRIFTEARRNLPASVFDIERWQRIAGDLWPKVVYVLNRGGRFEAFEKGYKGDQLAHPYAAMVNIYQEKTYDAKSAMTGEHLTAYAKYFPGPYSVTGEILDDEKDGFDLRMITYREITQTKSRTATNYWLLAVLPENFVLMNATDAAARGLTNGEVVKIISPTNAEGVWDLGNGNRIPMAGKIKTTQGIRPGVIGFSLGFGHWAYGGVDVVIDGVTVPGDHRRVKGIHANAAMRVDPYLGNTCLVDPVGGSAVFYDTQVKLVRI
jgi:anaerobic selenocysteine-containing dehydrogenase